MEACKRTIIVGDVHGCLEELIELLEATKFTGDDSLVFLGDLLDKGTAGPQAVRYVRKLSLKAKLILIKGNHEDTNLRFYYHDLKEKAGDKKTKGKNG